jgi:hypothetical protein
MGEGREAELRLIRGWLRSPQDLRREDGLPSPEEETRILSPSPVRMVIHVLVKSELLADPYL